MAAAVLNCYLLGLLALILPLASAAIDQPKSVCVADLTSQAQVTGYACKDPKQVTVNDFYTSNLNQSGLLTAPKGSSVHFALVTVNQVPGLNSAGVSLIRADFPVGALYPFHTNHVDEIAFVLSGTIEVGLLTGDYPNVQFFKKVLNQGDVFFFPQGLIHYNRNVGNGPATAIAALAGQNLKNEFIGDSLFSSVPAIDPALLASAFKTDTSVITKIVRNFGA